MARPRAPRPAEGSALGAQAASSPPRRADDGLEWLIPGERVVLLTGRPDELLPADQLRYELLAQRVMDTGKLTSDERARLVEVWSVVPTRDPHEVAPAPAAAGAPCGELAP